MKKKESIDPTTHILVPEHSKLNEKEKGALLKKYSITLKELPRIMKNDPAIATLGAKEGDIIKITRKSPTAGESIFYRCISNV
ncbi:DNA-directed RNA polymerase subunit H [Candidatus Woesearchaeota archaeon]|nr:DNA-directed RNA polymerase subunit H [Candidatus Woesearchaeota archaeon]